MKKYLLAAAFALFSQFIFAQDVSETKPAEKTEKIYEENQLDTKPEYAAGNQKLFMFLNMNLIAPDLDHNATITLELQFVVETDGTISNITVTKDPGYGLAEQAMSLLKKASGKWKPGTLNGKNVRSEMKIPITIEIKV